MRRGFLSQKHPKYVYLLNHSCVTFRLDWVLVSQTYFRNLDPFLRRISIFGAVLEGKLLSSYNIINTVLFVQEILFTEVCKNYVQGQNQINSMQLL